MTPAPCPCCGARLRRSKAGWAHPEQKEQRDKPCVLAGNFFGDKYLEWVGWPPQPVWHYEVVDGLPIFNQDGRGKPADIDFVNACFDYIRKETTDAA